jgi:environmental stress-induced protein Ves
LQPSDATLMPWRNGAGLTRELAVQRQPDGSLVWRVSVARVERSGPFSTFPGLARIITLLEGGGMVLRTGEAPPMVVEALRPHRFDGDASTDCTLLGGAVSDFNVIYDPRRVAAAVEVLQHPATVPPNGSTRFVHAVTAARLTQDGQTLDLGAGWSIIAAPDSIAPIDLQSGTALLVSFHAA